MFGEMIADEEIKALREENARLKVTLAAQDAMVEEAAYELTAAMRAALMDEMHDHALTLNDSLSEIVSTLTRERDEARTEVDKSDREWAGIYSAAERKAAAEVSRLEGLILRCVDVDRGTTDMMIEARRIRAQREEEK